MHNDQQFGLTAKALGYLNDPPRASRVNPFTVALLRRNEALRPRFVIIRPVCRSAESLSPAA